MKKILLKIIKISKKIRKKENNMDEKIKQIFNNLPYNSYEDFINAAKNNKAKLKYGRSACSQIAGIKHPYFSAFGLYIGFLFTAILLTFICSKINNYWFMLLIPFNFFLSSFIVYMKKTKYLCYILLFIDILIYRLPYWITVLYWNFLIIDWFYDLWWRIICSHTLQELEFNQEAFIWMWETNNIYIEDTIGNIYYKLKIDMENTNESK